MIGAPFVVLGSLLVLSALVGARVRGRSRGALGAFILSPLDPASWYATLSILLGFWVELLAFVLIVGVFSTGASLLVVGVGVAVIGLGIEASRLVARVERWRAALADPRPLRPHAYRPYGRGWRELFMTEFGDPSRWRDVVYVGVALPLAIIEFTLTVIVWGICIVLLSLPIWYLTASPIGGDPATSAIPLAVAVAGGLAGLVVAAIAASVSQGLMALHRAVVAGLLCDSEQRVLQRRVETLEESRKTVIDVEATELRRIERDLHDGAQQRLVMLSIDLGMAVERLDADPAAARALVVEAQDQARLALAELRDLVRGIAPAILLDRGLVAALSAIAGRCPVPTVVASTLPAGVRLPDAMERAAYFVVAEALANVGKHASAEHCEIRCRADERGLIVEVWDDGAGGARILPSGGLAGLAGRVEALDGTLTIESPEGGPTAGPRAVLPVAMGGPAAGGSTAGEPAAGVPVTPVPATRGR